MLTSSHFVIVGNCDSMDMDYGCISKMVPAIWVQSSTCVDTVPIIQVSHCRGDRHGVARRRATMPLSLGENTTSVPKIRSYRMARMPAVLHGQTNQCLWALSLHIFLWREFGKHITALLILLYAKWDQCFLVIAGMHVIVDTSGTNSEAIYVTTTVLILICS